ncbi:MAG: hypothetical protein ACRYGC_17265 [Janthinobacterium lividum]
MRLVDHVLAGAAAHREVRRLVDAREVPVQRLVQAVQADAAEAQQAERLGAGAALGEAELAVVAQALERQHQAAVVQAVQGRLDLVGPARVGREADRVQREGQRPPIGAQAEVRRACVVARRERQLGAPAAGEHLRREARDQRPALLQLELAERHAVACDGQDLGAPARRVGLDRRRHRVALRRGRQARQHQRAARPHRPDVVRLRLRPALAEAGPSLLSRAEQDDHRRSPLHPAPDVWDGTPGVGNAIV